MCKTLWLCLLPSTSFQTNAVHSCRQLLPRLANSSLCAAHNKHAEVPGCFGGWCHSIGEHEAHQTPAFHTHNIESDATYKMKSLRSSLKTTVSHNTGKLRQSKAWPQHLLCPDVGAMKLMVIAQRHNQTMTPGSGAQSSTSSIIFKNQLQISKSEGFPSTEWGFLGIAHYSKRIDFCKYKFKGICNVLMLFLFIKISSKMNYIPMCSEESRSWASWNHVPSYHPKDGFASWLWV